jgi:hypothetical protein
MVVKILSSAKSFNGVAYNENKFSSELLVAENFDGMMKEIPTKEDYKEYLIAFAKTNERVKKPQLHTTISGKGRENSFEELAGIGKEWLKKMGYGDQPYLIYGHKDTENNHVHIVSVRVDKKGKKINDSMERVRSNRIINEIMGIDLKEKAEQTFKNVSGYNFSSVQQFKLLLEKAGWGVREQDGNVYLSKGAAIQKIIEKNEIDQLIAKNFSLKDEDRRKQITALLHKYKAGLTHIELKNLMRDKFGIHLEFHTGKGHTTPYGYTVIDNVEKNVYKGSELVNLKELLVSPERQNKIDACNTLVKTILDSSSRMDFAGFQDEMNKVGYRVDAKGKIYLSGEKGVLGELEKEVVKKLNYHSRLNEADKFNIDSKGEKIVLSKIFFVKADDITGSNEKKGTIDAEYYSELMKAYLDSDKDMKESMEEKGFSFVKLGKDTYLIDDKEKVIISNNKLKLELENSLVRVRNLSQFENFDLERNSNYSKGQGLIEALGNIASQEFGVGEQDPRRRRRKK